MTEPTDPILHDDAFAHISALIARGEPLAVTLQQIVQGTCDLLEVAEAAIFLAEGTEPRMRLIAASIGMPEVPVLRSLNDSLEGLAYSRGRPIVANRPAASPQATQPQPWSATLPPEAIVASAAVPITNGGRRVGVLVVVDGALSDAATHHPLGQASTAELIPFLMVLADLVGLALENSDILQRQERRTQLIQMLKQIASIPVSEATATVANLVMNQLSAIMQADVASMLLHSAATDELVAFGSSDTPLAQLQRERELDHIPLAMSGPLLQVFQQLTPLTIETADGIEAFPLMQALGVQSMVVVPLCVEQACEGLLLVAATRPGAFTEDDVSFLSFISARIGYALHHDALSDELAAAEQARIAQDERENFIAIVAHDLKNALTSMAGSSQLALRRAARGDASYSQKALPVVVTKAAQALQLINDMVDITNVDAGRFRLFIAPVELVALLREEIEAAQTLSAAHHIQLDTILETIEIEADQQRLRQVLANLLSNAVRYSPNGSHVTVALTNVVAQTAPATVALASPSELPQEVQLTVADQGVGIAAEDLPYIFDRFYRGRGEAIASGSGLGLYIAAEIVAQHGGRLWVEATPGAGSRFNLTLPVRRAIQLRPPPTSRSSL